jgi:uncharacterized alkaline shock family protein YloU
MDEINNLQVREDRIRISDEVIATIAGIAAAEVEGVTSMSGGLADGIAGMLGKKNLGKGVKVELGEKQAEIELSAVVEYGCKIHIVAKEIQKKVREAVEDMTGLKVTGVDVNVVGINLLKEGKEVKKEISLTEDKKSE